MSELPDGQQKQRRRIHKTLQEIPDEQRPIAQAEWVGWAVGEALKQKESQRLLEHFNRLAQRTKYHLQAIQEGKQSYGEFWMEAAQRQKIIERMEQVRQRIVNFEDFLQKGGLLTSRVAFWTQYGWRQLERGKALLAHDQTLENYQRGLNPKEQKEGRLSVGFATRRASQDFQRSLQDLRTGLTEIPAASSRLRAMNLYQYRWSWIRGRHQTLQKTEVDEFQVQLRW